MPLETYELRDIETNELKVRLYKAIDELPQQCRKVFRMSRFENLKQQDIEAKLGISIKNEKNHITVNTANHFPIIWAIFTTSCRRI